MRIAIGTGLSALALLGLVAGCKPDKADVVTARRAEAAERAEQARKAVTDGQAAVAASAAATDLPPEIANVEVARFGEHRITLADVAARIRQQPPHMQARYASQANREELLRAMVQFEVIAAEAKRQGLDQQPRVQEAWKDALARALLEDVVRSGPTMADITEAEIAAWYEDKRDDFVQPERRRAAVLVLPTADEAAEVHAVLAKTIEATPKEARQIFGDFVRVRSKDEATAARKGDIGWLTAEGAPPEGVPGSVVKQAFAVDGVGDVSAPFPLGDGRFAVVQVTQVRPATTRTLQEARLDIQNALFREKQAQVRQDYIDALMAKTKVEILADRLDALPAPAAGQPAAGATPRAPHLSDERLRRGLVTTRPPGKSNAGREIPLDVNAKKPNLSPQEVQDLMARDRKASSGGSGSTSSGSAAPETPPPSAPPSATTQETP